MLNFYKRMLQVRKQSPALIEGDYQPLAETSNAYFAFLRRSPEQTCLVILNLSDRTHMLDFDFESQEIRPLFSSHASHGETISTKTIEIAPHEIFIGELIS